jgi:hypothetical protein
LRDFNDHDKATAFTGYTSMGLLDTCPGRPGVDDFVALYFGWHPEV